MLTSYFPAEYVNMTPDELSEWLKTEESQTAGWSKANTGKVEEGQESVGHESGRKIVRSLFPLGRRSLA
jgi:hypothetical protein